MVNKVDILYCTVCIVCKYRYIFRCICKYYVLMYMNMCIVKIYDYTICIQVQIDIYKLVFLNVPVHIFS